MQVVLLLFIRTWSQVLGCRTQGGSGASADSLVNGRNQDPKDFRVVSTQGQVKSYPEDCIGLLAGRSLVIGPGISELISNLYWTRES